MAADRPPESLLREIWAILVLYLVIAILPLLIGWACAPSTPP